MHYELLMAFAAISRGSDAWLPDRPRRATLPPRAARQAPPLPGPARACGPPVAKGAEAMTPTRKRTRSWPSVRPNGTLVRLFWLARNP